MRPVHDWKIAMIENAAKRLTIALASVSQQAPMIAEAGAAIGEVLKLGGKILVAGNGGSAACAQHFAAEFTGKLAVERDPMPAIALSVDTSALTAIANDWAFEEVYGRQIRAYGRPGDVFVGISTSGKSKNVRVALEAAKRAGLTTILLTGPTNSLGKADHEISVRISETSRIQEVHDQILHDLVQIAERTVFSDLNDDASANRFPFELGAADLPAFRAWTLSSRQSVVTTNGVFDLLHEGHLSTLRQAREHGDQLVVLMNSDASVARLKGSSRPIQGQKVRARQLRRSGLVDHIVLMPHDSPVELLEQLKPDVHCKGLDYASRPMPEREVIEKNGGKVELLDIEEGISTSSIVDTIVSR